MPATATCRRFWVARGEDLDLSDGGFLADPEIEANPSTPSAALPFETIAACPVLILLGEPGMGKTTALAAYEDQTEMALSKSGETIWRIDLSACTSDTLLNQRVLSNKYFKRTKLRKKVHIFLDGFDQCLQWVPSLGELLLECFVNAARSRHGSNRVPDGRLASRT